MDYKETSFWFSVFQFIFMLFVAAYSWIRTKHKANQSAIDEVDDRLIRVERDLEHLPKNMPSRDELVALHQRLNKTNEKLDGLGGQLSQISPNIHLIHEFLLKGDK